jgi:hypothetical protein
MRIFAKSREQSTRNVPKVTVANEEPVYFDLDTVLLLREILDEAWACTRPKQKATTNRPL